MDLTPAELVVLGLLVERPQHGYDLEQTIDRRGIRQWTEIGFSSIYYLLAKLERRGLVEAPTEPTGPKGRRVLHPTESGRSLAARTASALVAEADPVSHPVLVGLANLPLIPPEEYRAALRTRRAQLAERVAGVRAARAAQEPLPMPAREVFSYSLALLEAELTWLESRTEEDEEEHDG